jgi:hypothetical protein
MYQWSGLWGGSALEPQTQDLPDSTIADAGRVEVNFSVNFFNLLL